ncbi:MAG TPA: C1 family peptidase [Pseudonocardiaceae bacterium]|nr:C1 family peptidase [Pseudonocardiaceae bacterium]
MRTDRRYGWTRDLPDHRDLVRAPASAALANLPAKVDLRGPYMPDVYNQLGIGSCTSNAIAAAVEFALRRQKLADFMPSRLFVYYNERAAEGSVGSDAGAQIRDGIASVARQGVCPESMWPYDGTAARSDGTWPAGHRAALRPTEACYRAAKQTEAIRYERVVQELAHLKACLAAGEPFVFGFTVCASFESEQVAATGEAQLPGPGEQVLGGHAVLATGYDDDRQRFLVHNSWGTEWGMDGYFTMPYAYLANNRLASDMWAVTLVS